VKTIDSSHLLHNYDAVLLDAFGVLVDASGVLPHAQDFIAALQGAKRPFFIVTNDASRLPESIAQRFAGLGLPIGAEQIVTSAGLLTQHYQEAGLQGATTMVLGPPDAHTYVQRAGGVPVAPSHQGAMPDVRAIVVCEAAGAQLMNNVECAIDTVVAQREAGRPVDLILCNPDLIYPRSAGRYGLTSGSAMALIELSLATRLTPPMRPSVARLGKPFGSIFAEAARRAGSHRLALVGDQLGTDIRGAKDFGIDAILVGTGLTQVKPGEILDPCPDFYLPDLKLPSHGR
jgi:HAD superfamily hydrolase (TIGR01450 family)